jgi:hypothetical protein
MPVPGTVAIEGTHDSVEVTFESSLDPGSWPRIAICKLCGRGIRLAGLLFDWTLAAEQPRRMSAGPGNVSTGAAGERPVSNQGRA